ncbi:MAG: cobalt transporter CbiM [Breoghania sp.]|nr:cobalt transporter CbiM [Breoghania sp.]MDJ0933290.1 cobalt transporter CbiM [Breoghania sp.]
MAHIPDGILSAPVLIGGAVIAVGGVGLGLRRLDDRTLPRAGILAAAFFAGSLIVVPVGPSSVHLLLSGLMGILLGFATFPALAVALLLQAFLFGFGGLTSLDVNIVDMALPGVVLAMIFGPTIRNTTSQQVRMGLSALVGALAVLGTDGCVALALTLSSPDLYPRRQRAACDLHSARHRGSLHHRRGGWFPRPRFPSFSEACPVMIRSVLLSLAMALALAFGLAGPAAAHKLKVFATVEGDAMTGYAFFIGGGRAMGTPWVAKDAAGKVIASGKTARGPLPPRATRVRHLRHHGHSRYARGPHSLRYGQGGSLRRAGALRGNRNTERPRIGSRESPGRFRRQREGKCRIFCRTFRQADRPSGGGRGSAAGRTASGADRANG